MDFASAGAGDERIRSGIEESRRKDWEMPELRNKVRELELVDLARHWLTLTTLTPTYGSQPCWGGVPGWVPELPGLLSTARSSISPYEPFPLQARLSASEQKPVLRLCKVGTQNP